MITIVNEDESWIYNALVCENVGEVIIGGNPLLDQGINPVTYRNEIDIVTSSSGLIRKLPWRPPSSHPRQKPRIGILRSDESLTLFPGDYLDMKAPQEYNVFGDAEVLVRPRSVSGVYSVTVTSTKYAMDLFPPPEYTWMIQGRIRLLNSSSFPIIIPKHRHIADVSLVTSGANLFPIFKVPQIHLTSNFTSTLYQPSKPPPHIPPVIQHLKNPSYNYLPDPSLYPHPKPDPPVCEAAKVALDPDNQTSRAETSFLT